jgi:LPXTG-site transpeptidase (sortase) family protein
MPSVTYDSNGDIILPDAQVKKTFPAPRTAQKRISEWNVVKGSSAEQWKKACTKVSASAGAFFLECAEQYAESVRSTLSSLKHLRIDMKRAFTALSAFLFQPVWIPRKRSTPKQRSRLHLFATDVLRFGTTFASLFAVLFIALNFQSIWSIMNAFIDPLSAAEASEKLSQTLKTSSVERAAAMDGSLLSMLPPVGPPDNRLVIPRLGLNVPIVTPPTDALIAENWSKLEQDIQHALQDGVVQYPGTAKPGQAGNTFITGHSSYYPGMPGNFKSVFARLTEMELGDEYIIYYGGDKHRYRVTEKKEVRPTDVSVLDQPTGKREGTLMTCTPLGTTLRRLIVKAEEVDPITGEILEVGEHLAKPDHPQVKMEMLPI